MLIALTAPRLLYATNASKDLWADPTGTYLSLKHAQKVYAFYGFVSSLPERSPGIDRPVSTVTLAYHNREGAHDMTIYWTRFLEFTRIRFK